MDRYTGEEPNENSGWLMICAMLCVIVDQVHKYYGFELCLNDIDVSTVPIVYAVIAVLSLVLADVQQRAADGVLVHLCCPLLRSGLVPLLGRFIFYGCGDYSHSHSTYYVASLSPVGTCNKGTVLCLKSATTQMNNLHDIKWSK